MDCTTMVFHNIAGAVRLTGAILRILGSFAVHPLQATCNSDNLDSFLLIRP